MLGIQVQKLNWEEVWRLLHFQLLSIYYLYDEKHQSSILSLLTMGSLRQPRLNDFEAIIRSNSLYERLVSGQESVSGEASQ
jgi:hypothetical protein